MIYKNVNYLLNIIRNKIKLKIKIIYLELHEITQKNSRSDAIT